MSLTSAVFWECETPAATPSTVFTTIWTTVMPAVCETGESTTVYTITDSCACSPDDYTRPAVPPHFETTTVTCHVCNVPTQTLYVPPPPTQPACDGGCDSDGPGGESPDGDMPGGGDGGMDEPSYPGDMPGSTPDGGAMDPSSDVEPPVATAAGATIKRGIAVATAAAMVLVPLVFL